MQRTVPSVEEQMKGLLAPLRPSWVAERVGVSRQTVDRWKNGSYVTAEHVDDVVRVLRALLPEHQPDQAPVWATELAAGVESRITAAISEASAAPVVDRVADQLLDTLRERAPQLFGGDAPAAAPSTE